MQKLRIIYEATLFAGVVAAAFMIAFLAVSVSVDILLRNVGWGNLPWVLEVSEYLLFISTFLAAPWGLKAGAHVRVDVAVRLLPPRMARWVDAAAHLVGLAVCLVIFYYGVKVTLEALRLNTLIFKYLVVPEWWLMLFLPLAALFLVAEFLLVLLGRRGESGEGVIAAPSRKGL